MIIMQVRKLIHASSMIMLVFVYTSAPNGLAYIHASLINTFAYYTIHESPILGLAYTIHAIPRSDLPILFMLVRRSDFKMLFGDRFSRDLKEN